MHLLHKKRLPKKIGSQPFRWFVETLVQSQEYTSGIISCFKEYVKKKEKNKSPKGLFDYLFKIKDVNSIGSTILSPLYTLILPDAISSIKITSLLL